jgi:hypothetical protein
MSKLKYYLVENERMTLNKLHNADLLLNARNRDCMSRMSEELLGTIGGLTFEQRATFEKIFKMGYIAGCCYYPEEQD